MRKPAWLLFFSFFVFSSNRIQSIALAKDLHTPPFFNDAKRVVQVESTFPIVSKMFLDLAKRDHFPGLAFGIVLDGRLVYVGHTGFSNLKEKTTAGGQSLFRIASMTKSFVALAILMLRDEGKLQLDDPVRRFIPELDKSTPLITIRHLLTHSAGFPEDNPWGDRQMADSEDEFTQLLNSGLSFSTAPGTGYEYSNLGFALLGRIITRASGHPYQKFITEKILQPLHMNDTVWEYNLAPAGRLALGYKRVEENWIEQPMLHDGSFGAIGGLITSVEDFSKYMALHMSAWPVRDDADNGLIKSSSLREMQQCWRVINQDLDYTNGSGKSCPVINGYGYGLRWVRDCQGHVFVGHSGGLPGFGSHWRMLPDYGIGVVVFANRTYADLSKSVYTALDTIIALARLQPHPIPVSDILEKRKRDLLQVLPNWQIKNDEPFAENFFLDFSADSLRRQFDRLYRQAGKIVNVTQVVPRNQLRGTFSLQGEKAEIEIFFTLSPENPAKIQYIEFREKAH